MTDHDLVPLYVAHPLGDGPEREVNRKRAAIWVGWLADRYLCAPVCTWITIAEVWPESKRELGLAIDRALVEFCKLVVLVGDHVSPGMMAESAWAEDVLDLTFPGCQLPEHLDEDNLPAIDCIMQHAGINRRHHA